MAKIYNVPASCSLTDTLAQKLLKDCDNNLLELTKIKIFLPNQRASRELRNAFVRANGTNATLLPQIASLNNIDDNFFFTSENYLNIPKTISKSERLLLFIRLITARPDNFQLEHLSFAQACYLARELSSLVDSVNNENLDFSNLEKLVPEEYASHWQNILCFLKIITEFYPQILKERNLIDVSQHEQYILEEQISCWQKNPPQEQIIIAGTTATFPAMKKLVKLVLSLPRGEIWLSGLDKNLDNDSWQKIDEQHPQFELKELLDYLEISRFEIKDIVSPLQPEREKFLSEVMRPASSSEKWRDISSQNISEDAIKNFHMISCRDSREEALTIASIMRQNLEIPEKTTALITTDRTLARRVSDELLRWDIKADDSAGIPLLQTPQGIFLRLIASICQDNYSPLSLLSLYKHPLCCCGKSIGYAKQQIRLFEKEYLRKRSFDQTEEPDFIKEQKEILSPLTNLLAQTKANFKLILKTHLEIAEKLASQENISGDKILWSTNSGETAAEFFAELLESADTLRDIPQGQYVDFFESLLAGTMVRDKYGAHPRLRILGAIEARLCSFDCTIIGGLNEGTMPESTSSNAWLSRPMEKNFGLPLPEKSIGVLAHDFYELSCKKEVYLTRAEKVQSSPTIKSRWWLRLETVIEALGFDFSKLSYFPYLKWIHSFDETDKISPISAPEPTPPLESRPRELWASDIEKLLLDPYSIFASKILKLRKLNDINLSPDAIDLGIIVHSLLEKFYTAYPHNFPDNASNILLEMAQKSFEENNIPADTIAFWQPRILKIIKWITSIEKTYHGEIKQTLCEKPGKITIQTSNGNFIIGAKADRIDITQDNKINIIDYKTGRAHSAKEIQNGFAPQLPLEGIIAQEHGFDNNLPTEVKTLSYWKLGEKTISVEKNVDTVLTDNFHKIKKLINHFDNPNSAYITKPNYKHGSFKSDYTHLSRIDEWGISNDDE
ncbi:MAG: PD-(D/E)XK nuclease family protein [Alphaproteobacteria bacterium]|nr:PD-(D/E)XK nuclease family protein [Alphaproteobacteria bacterium]